MDETCTSSCKEGQPLDHLVILLSIATSLSLYAFVRSTWSGNLGQVDKYWSFLPAVYSWVCYLLLPTNRGLLAATLTSIWAVRLTYNFARKGGYTEEDYRWAYMRSWFPGKLALCCFNFWFISIAENLFLLGFSLPGYVITLYPGSDIGLLDWVFTVLFLAFLLLEAAGDQQQWNYQKAKAEAKGKENVEKRLLRGFVKEGLFKYSRHPHFFGELGLWWAYYGFSIAASGQFLHWSIIGPTVLTAIFQGSTDLTEKISSSKYPEYAEYQKTTSRIIPWVPKVHGKEA